MFTVEIIDCVQGEPCPPQYWVYENGTRFVQAPTLARARVIAATFNSLTKMQYADAWRAGMKEAK